MVPFLRRSSNTAARGHLPVPDAQPSNAQPSDAHPREPPGRLHKLSGYIRPLSKHNFPTWARALCPWKQKTTSPSPSRSVVDQLEDLLEEAITNDVAQLIHPKNLIHPISTEGLAYAEDMRDGLVLYEGVVGEGSLVDLVRSMSFEGVESSMGVVCEEAENWDLDEIQIPVYPEASWTGGVKEVQRSGDRDARGGRLCGNGSSCTDFMRREESMTANAVATQPRLWQRGDRYAERAETSPRQIRLAWEGPTVATEREDKFIGFGKPRILLGDGVLSGEMPVSAQVDRLRPAGDMTPHMLIFDKVIDSDDDSDYVSWTLEDQWVLEGRLEELI